MEIQSIAEPTTVDQFDISRDGGGIDYPAVPGTDRPLFFTPPVALDGPAVVISLQDIGHQIALLVAEHGNPIGQVTALAIAGGLAKDQADIVEEARGETGPIKRRLRPADLDRAIIHRSSRKEDQAFDRHQHAADRLVIEVEHPDRRTATATIDNKADVVDELPVAFGEEDRGGNCRLFGRHRCWRSQCRHLQITAADTGAKRDQDQQEGDNAHHL